MSTIQQSDVTVFPATPVTVTPPPLPRSVVIKNALGLIGKEALVAVMIYFLCTTLLKPLCGSLAVIVSGGSSEVRLWGVVFSFALALAIYGFDVGRSPEKHRLWRIALHSVFQLGLLARAFRILPTSQALVLGIAAALTSFLLCALVGSRFRQAKTEKKTDAKSANKEAAKFVVHGIIGFGVAIGIKLGSAWLSGHAQDMIYVGKQAPATVYQTDEGTSWSLAEQQGKVVLVEFWSPNCGPCLSAFPHLKEIHERYKDRTDFEMVSVAAGGSPQAAQEIFDRYEAQWTLLHPPTTSSPDDLKPDFVPSAFIIDTDGTIVAAAIRSTTIDHKLEQLFETQ